MYTLIFVCNNGQKLQYEHINSVAYTRRDKTIKLTETELIEKPIPIGVQLWLTANNKSFIVNGADLLSIEITAE